jgi:hypothetical protein
MAAVAVLGANMGAATAPAGACSSIADCGQETALQACSNVLAAPCSAPASEAPPLCQPTSYIEGCVPDHSVPDVSVGCGAATTTRACGGGPSGYEYTYCGEFDGRKARAHDWCYAGSNRYYTDNAAYYPYGTDDRNWRICAAFNDASNNATVAKQCTYPPNTASNLYCRNAFNRNYLRLRSGVGNEDYRDRTINGYATDNEYGACGG